MQHSNGPTGTARYWYRRFLEHTFATPAFLLHTAIFVALTLVAIARYSRNVPAEYTVLMEIWSILLLVHGVVARRRSVGIEKSTEDGVPKIIFVATLLNAVMWGMWTLATDGRDSTPWHLTVWLVMATVATLALVLGKRMLYVRWEREYESGGSTRRRVIKAKRQEDAAESLLLTDDGELLHYFDGTSDRVEKH